MYNSSFNLFNITDTLLSKTYNIFILIRIRIIGRLLLHSLISALFFNSRGLLIVANLLLSTVLPPLSLYLCIPQLGLTALHIAAWKGHSEVLQLLLEVGADPTSATHSDKTPLQLAHEENRHRCVSILTATLKKVRIKKTRLWDY